MLLIKFFGLRRSGNHAVINWILGLENDILFFNQVNLYEDPVITHSPISVPKNVRTPKVRVNGKVKNTNISIYESSSLNKNILCSYEHINMNSLDIKKLNHSIFSRLGNYDNHINVYVIRNIFNVIPSLLKLISKTKKRPLEVKEIRYTVKDLIMLWRGYACLTLSNNSETRSSFVPILYEKWLMEQDYRNEIAKEFGFINKDKNIDFVSDAGGGSSWNGIDNKVDKSSLLNRWQDILPNERQIVIEVLKENLDIIDLVSKFFGNLSIPNEIQYLIKDK